MKCCFQITYNSNIVGCFINRNWNKYFWSTSRQLMTEICFRIGLDIDGLTLVLRFEIFLSTFVKMADFQGLRNSSDILLICNNFQFMAFGSLQLELTYNLTKFLFLIYP